MVTSTANDCRLLILIQFRQLNVHKNDRTLRVVPATAEHSMSACHLTLNSPIINLITAGRHEKHQTTVRHGYIFICNLG